MKKTMYLIPLIGLSATGAFLWFILYYSDYNNPPKATARYEVSTDKGLKVIYDADTTYELGYADAWVVIYPNPTSEIDSFVKPTKVTTSLVWSGASEYYFTHNYLGRSLRVYQGTIIKKKIFYGKEQPETKEDAEAEKKVAEADSINRANAILQDQIPMPKYSARYEQHSITYGKINSELYTQKIRFSKGGYDLAQKDTMLLNQLVNTLRNNKRDTVILCGYIDTSDYPISSYAWSSLSYNRGWEVAHYLTQHGISEGRIQVWISCTDYPQAKRMRIELAER